MSNWNAAHYLRYGDERTRAAADLAARIQLDQPSLIADLGCGPGNSTQILRTRWPQAMVVGIDNSPEMIQAAQRSYPTQDWQLADASEWTPDEPVNLIFSNAAFQWLPNHDRLLLHLCSILAPGGALAFQIPSSAFAKVRQLIHDISLDSAWTERMNAPRDALTMEHPSFYYDALVDNATDLDIWETEYFHILDSKDSIIDWIASTGLRPFLAALSNDDERHEFLKELKLRVHAAYETRADGKVLFPFRRTFVIAYH